MKQTIRIIGGHFRGKKLHFPAIEQLRPTPNRVRETLFNWLMHDIRDARCLDAFAGSGALGFEAYSRGAAKVVFLETNKLAVTSLRQQAASFNTTVLKVENIDFFNFIKTTQHVFDIVFLDPPFSKNCLPECMTHLASSNALRPGALVYVEAPSHIELENSNWQTLKQQKAGQIVYGLYQQTCSICPSERQ